MVNELHFYNLNSNLQINYTSISFDVSFNAGTIGTRGIQLSYDLSKTSWYKNNRIIGIVIIYIKDSSTIIPIAFIAGSTVFLNVYRATDQAVANNSVQLRILYSKLDFSQ